MQEFLLYSGFKFINGEYTIKLFDFKNNVMFINYIYIFTPFSRRMIDEYCNDNPDEVLYISIDNDDSFTLKTSLVQSYNTKFKKYALEEIIQIDHFINFFKDEIRQMKLNNLLYE